MCCYGARLARCMHCRTTVSNFAVDWWTRRVTRTWRTFDCWVGYPSPCWLGLIVPKIFRMHEHGLHRMHFGKYRTFYDRYQVLGIKQVRLHLRLLFFDHPGNVGGDFITFRRSSASQILHKSTPISKISFLYLWIEKFHLDKLLDLLLLLSARSVNGGLGVRFWTWRKWTHWSACQRRKMLLHFVALDSLARFFSLHVEVLPHSFILFVDVFHDRPTLHTTLVTLKGKWRGCIQFFGFSFFSVCLEIFSWLNLAIKCNNFGYFNGDEASTSEKNEERFASVFTLRSKPLFKAPLSAM